LRPVRLRHALKDTVDVDDDWCRDALTTLPAGGDLTIKIG
jgi:hypothetical protein